MTTEIKQSYLDKLSVKPMPKIVQRFFANNLPTPNPDEEPDEEKDPTGLAVKVVDKRKSVSIDCEQVWTKINRRVGTVFDRRKMKNHEDRDITRDRYVSDHLATVLGKRTNPPNKPGLSPNDEQNQEPLPLLMPTPEKLDVVAEPTTTIPPEIVAKDSPYEVSPSTDVQVNIGEPVQYTSPEVAEKAPRKPRKQSKAVTDAEDALAKTTINDQTTINGKLVLSRLPKPDKIIIRAPTYYMTNRKLYMKKLADLFKDYNKDIAAEVRNASCDTQSSEEFQMLIHQHIVRDYLNLYTPYRGLLLYHGLGSGKTCTSIAIAEGMKSHRKIFIMTPASLKMNFFSELKKCGDSMYKKKQYWEFVSITGQPQNTALLAKVLSLPVEFILKHKGAWLMDTTKPQSNYSELSNDQQKVLDEQLNAMIRAKYVDINYNGLNKDRVDKLFDTQPNGDEINPFDNAVVMIDEAHNFVSRISNKLNAEKSIPYRLYQKLLRAENARIVLMTGTPMINYPNELGILFNLLRGVIRTWTFNITEKRNIVKDNIVDMFKTANMNTYDYIDYANGKLTITRNPFGFVNAIEMKRGGNLDIPAMVASTTFIHTEGGAKIEETGGKIEEKIEETGGKPKRKYIRRSSTLKYKKMLNDAYTKIHPTLCADLSVEQTKPMRKRTTQNKRMKGKLDIKFETEIDDEKPSEEPRANLNKYQNLEEILDEPNKTTTSLLPIEETDLKQEILDYSNNMGDPHEGGGGNPIIKGGDQIVHPNYRGVYLNEQGNITDEMFVSQVKNVLRRNGIEIAGKETVNEYLALPESQTDFLTMFVEDSTLQVQNINLFKKRILGLTSYFRSAQEKLLPQFVPDEKGEIYHIEKVEMSDYQLGVYNQIRSDESNKDSNMKKFQNANRGKADANANAKDLYKTASSYRIFSRAACNFTFPSEIPRPMPKSGKKGENAEMSEEELDNMNDGNMDDMYVDENAPAKIHDREYQAEILATLASLKNFEDGKYLRPDMLKLYSPKFLRVLENIQNPANRGLHLVYSNFRSLEGIGIFKLVLEANGFAEFKLQRNGDLWEIRETDPDLSKPRFVLYTGTETNEEKEIIRNIYNSQWDLVPTSIAGRLRENAENNYYGEVIRIIMITASGAEGINLANTRFVHIIEPYWNLVRVDQVVGRARRICSHKNLPEEMRTVQVFLYMSTYSATQRVDPKYSEIMKETGRFDPTFSVTTDENLYDISVKKNNINKQLLNGIKETAIDCSLYKKGNGEQNLVCYGEGMSYRTNEFGIFPSLDEDQIVREEINTRKVTRKMKKITVKQPNGLPDKIYAKYDRDNQLYDWDIYENSGQEKLVGRKEGDNVVEF